MDEVMLSDENIEKESSEGLVTWERFMPKMSLRVLLIEADDSTRNIVAALLRKCNYKVASVSDGLKAWEVLKGRANTIDLILTEVEMPSISGYALLTLIMEHEICRNIPVIMMSPQDSISTVHKCMMKGASDYLVKPLRINELRNLWQHVWRRQIAANVGNRAQNESTMKQYVKATSENNVSSRHSSDRECAHRNQEYMDKGNEAQSTTKLGLEDESADMDNMHCMQSNEGRSFRSDSEIQKQERFIKGDVKDDNATSSAKDIGSKNPRRDASEASESNDALINPTRETAGSAGAFYGRQPICRYEGSLNCGTSKLDSSPRLDSLLRSLHPSGFENKACEERRTLNHSRTSAFTRYVSKPLQHMNSIIGSTSDQHKEDTAVSSTDKSDHPYAPLYTQKVFGSLASRQSDQSKNLISCPEAFRFPVQLRSLQHDNMYSSYLQLPPIFHLQSVGPQLTSPSSAGQQESLNMTAVDQSNMAKSSSGQCHGQTKLAHNMYFSYPQLPPIFHLQSVGSQLTSPSSAGQPESLQMTAVNQSTIEKSSSRQCHLQTKLAHNIIDQSASGSLSINGANQMNMSRLVSACGNNGGNPTVTRSDESTHRASLREAALIKFLQKRKNRCYGKKVRYENRKKLAEKRPRVKGQFVCHVDRNTTKVESNDQSPNSSDG